MTLSELIERVGNDNITFEMLLERIQNATQTKNGTKISFISHGLQCKDLVTDNPPVAAIVVYMPFDKLEEALSSEAIKLSKEEQ